MKIETETLGVARSNLIEQPKGGTKPRRSYQKGQDAALVPRDTALVSKRPAYGYRRITTI